MMPGIGDSIWVLQKLINSDEKFLFHISDGKPQRGKQVFDMLPQVSAGCSYVPGLNYKNVRRGSEEFVRGNFRDIKRKDFFLEANTHLEEGKRIEDFLPDLDMTYCLPWVTVGSEFAPYHLPEFNITDSSADPLYIGIYGTAYSTARAWGFWEPDGWYEFIKQVRDAHAAKGQDVIFVIIGALFDLDLGSQLIAKLRLNGIKYFNTIGQPLPYVVDMLRYLDYFVGFPSGLSIINETLHKKTFMFYPEHLDKLRFSWPEESRIGTEYIAPLFCSPAEAFALYADKSSML